MKAALIPADHLHRHKGVLKNASPESHLILAIHSDRMIRTRTWHHQRLFFLLSSHAHFLQELKEEGFRIVEIFADSTPDGVAQFRKENPGVEIESAEPSSHQQLKQFKELGITLVENDFFLTSRRDFTRWANNQKNLLMENFYRAQRTRLNVLMDGSQPIAGQWNFDHDNRLPPPKLGHQWPRYLHHAMDEIDTQVLDRIESKAYPVVGATPDGTWGTTRKAAVAQLQHFITYSLRDFGPYEDAMPNETWAVNHSLLSPYLNNGLLHADEVLSAVLREFEKGDVPIASAEGFIRQLIGWREYINGIYWHFEESYRDLNGLGATRKLLPLFDDHSKTSMKCVSSIVEDVEDRAWVHHIPRLMVLSNLALLAGVSPQEFLDWMRRLFIDAADWVMVPNVIGMGAHADNGQMMTKPYVAGGSYISKMSRYCKGCSFNPKLRVGETACPFTTLYWDFLIRNREVFAGNHRMAQQLAGIDRLSDAQELQVRAREVLSLLSAGEL